MPLLAAPVAAEQGIPDHRALVKPRIEMKSNILVVGIQIDFEPPGCIMVISLAYNMAGERGQTTLGGILER